MECFLGWIVPTFGIVGVVCLFAYAAYGILVAAGEKGR